jgi:hypothetical protein
MEMQEDYFYYFIYKFQNISTNLNSKKKKKKTHSCPRFITYRKKQLNLQTE